MEPVNKPADPVVAQQGPQQDRPNLQDVLLWAKNHVEAMTAANVAPWHLLRAQMILDGLAALSASRIDPPPCQCQENQRRQLEALGLLEEFAPSVDIADALGQALIAARRAAAVVPSPSAPELSPMLTREFSEEEWRIVNAALSPAVPVILRLRVLTAIRQRTAAISSSSVADLWQPIETAPKNRTVVMLYGCEYGRRIWGRGYYFKGVPGDGEGWIASSFYTEPEDDMRGCFTPSHWMPLPKPPSASSASAEADR